MKPVIIINREFESAFLKGFSDVRASFLPVILDKNNKRVDVLGKITTSGEAKI